MKNIAGIFFILTLVTKAQDKLIFRNGTVQHGQVISIAREFVFFRISDTSAVQQIKKSNLALIETYKGERYLFAKTEPEQHETGVNKKADVKNRNYLGIQPFAIFVGRITLVYEHLSKNGNVGLVIPASITFNPFNVFYKSASDSSNVGAPQVTGLSYIVGGDLNFYIGKTDRRKFFIGPRVRYGTDQMLDGTEGYSIQTQFGWRFNSTKGFAQHLSVGFGFVRILSALPNTGVDPKQSYAWYSLNYRLSLNW